MSADPLLEVYTGLSLGYELKVAPALSGVLVQEYGFRNAPPESVKEWLAIDVLSMPQLPSRPGTWKGNVLFQVSAFSRGAGERTDVTKVDAPGRLAAKVNPVFRQRNVSIKSHGTDPVVQVATLSVREPRLERIPPLERSDVWCVALTFTGFMFVG